MKDCNIYALYSGDDNLMDGTLQEIADRRGVKRESLQWMMRPAYLRRPHNLEIILVKRVIHAEV